MSDTPRRSPKVTTISRGRMEVEAPGVGRDFKLRPGGGRERDWTEMGNHQVPGIRPSDVEDLLEHGRRVVILSRGMDLVLRTCPETLKIHEETGISVHVEETQAAVTLYNRPAETRPVGGLFHPTCRRRTDQDSR